MNNSQTMSQTTDAEFAKLLDAIISDPEAYERGEIEMNNDDMLRVYNTIKPYGSVIEGPDPDAISKTCIAASFTNLREDYIRRNTTTSLIGFSYQMLSEWEAPDDVRNWKSTAAQVKPFNLTDTVKHLTAALELAKAAHAAETDAAACAAAALEMDVVLASDASQDQQSAVADAYAKSHMANGTAAELLYAIAHSLTIMGTNAAGNIDAIVESSKRMPGMAKLFKEFPAPKTSNEHNIPLDVANKIAYSFMNSMFKFNPNAHVRTADNAEKIRADLKSVRDGFVVDAADPDHLPLESIARPAIKPLPAHAEVLSLLTADSKITNAVIAILRDGDVSAAMTVAINEHDTFCSYIENPTTVNDEHKPMIEILTSTMSVKSELQSVLSSDIMRNAVLHAIENSAEFIAYLFPIAETSVTRAAVDIIPPQDIFQRFGTYCDTNFEELRTITEAIYPERPELDWTIAAWRTFEGTQAEIVVEFDEYCQKHQDVMPSDIVLLDTGGRWTFLGGFKKNRGEKINFYNKNTEVFKRIIERHAEDKKMGAPMMRNRVKHTKAKNIARDGPDAAGLKGYKQHEADGKNTAAGAGAEKVIPADEMRRLEMARGDVARAKEFEHLEEIDAVIARLGELEGLRELSVDEARELKSARADRPRILEMTEVPDDGIQIDVFTNDTNLDTFTKSHFYTAAVDPEDVPVGGTPLAEFAIDALISDQGDSRTDADRHADAMRDKS
jgi:hypothetical protein